MKNNTAEKKKYNVEIADVQLSILSDDPEEFVESTVKLLDNYIRTLTVQNKRCAKIDAAVLCALDFLGDKLKLEKKVKSLEAQVDLYEANLRRAREDSAKAATVKEEPKKEETPAPVKEAAPVKKTAKAPEGQLSVTDTTPAAEEAPAPGSREDKLRQIELLMRAGGKRSE